MAVIGVSGQRLGVQDERASLTAFVGGGGKRDLDAELVGFVGLALADALGLRGVPGIELPAALPLLLLADLRGPAKGRGKDFQQALVAVNLAPDIADHAVQAGAQELDPLVHALELFGVGIAPGHHRRRFCHPLVGLAKRHLMVLGQFAQLTDCRLQELGVSGEGNVLGLHRGVDGDAGQIAFLQGAGVVGDAQAFLQENVHPIADALAPMAHAGALVRQGVLEKLLAGKILEIGVIHPAVPDLLVS